MPDLQPIHGELPLLGEARLRLSAPPYELVTFLNRTLKGRGLVFGLRQAGPGEYELRVYDELLPSARPAAPNHAAGRPPEMDHGR